MKKVKIDLQYFLSTGRNMYDNRYANFDAILMLTIKTKIRARWKLTQLKSRERLSDKWESSINIGKSY